MYWYAYRLMIHDPIASWLIECVCDVTIADIIVSNASE